MRKGWRTRSRVRPKAAPRVFAPLIESTWQRLPLALTNSLGPRLRRFITL